MTFKSKKLILTCLRVANMSSILLSFLKCGGGNKLFLQSITVYSLPHGVIGMAISANCDWKMISYNRILHLHYTNWGKHITFIGIRICLCFMPIIDYCGIWQTFFLISVGVSVLEGSATDSLGKISENIFSCRIYHVLRRLV